ncbi:MAG: hypothetical protein M1832_005171 [Thelocarpon impressellum]|nr:MAG: hypothetical protein M1832_005171 [Thelocarpon impressellum]
MSFSSSPTVVLRAQPTPQPFLAREPSLSPPDFTNPASFGRSSAPTALAWCPPADAAALARPRAPVAAPLPMACRGSKRSRDDADGEEDMAARVDPPATPPPSGSLHGPPVSAASQTAPETADLQQKTPPVSAAVAPRLLSRKSQRLDTSAPSSYSAPGSPSITSAPTTASPAAADPPIDASALLLGVGWTTLSPSPTAPDQDPSKEAAIRGWTRYIANHYPLAQPTLLLHSAGLSAYLVRAAEGFYLFKDDLSEARLVARREADALRNLRRSPVVFEGGEGVLRGVGTPRAEARQRGGDGEAGSVFDMELD